MTDAQRMTKIYDLLKKTIDEKDAKILTDYLSLRKKDGTIASYSGKDLLVEKIINKYEEV